MPHNVSRPRPSGRIPGACDFTGSGSGLGVSGGAASAEGVIIISATTASAIRKGHSRYVVIFTCIRIEGPHVARAPIRVFNLEAATW